MEKTMENIRNKVVVITGDGSGIGDAIADAVAHAISQPENASVNEIILRATAQEF